MSASPGRRRLALVHYTAPPVLGGVEAILGEQARWLRRLGHDVTVVTGRGDGVVVPLVDSRHPRVEAVAEALAAGAEPAAELESLSGDLVAALGPHLADRDCVIAHNVLTMPFNLALAHALTRLPSPLVAWTHDLAWINPRYLPFQRPSPLLDLLHTAQPGVRYVAISQVRREEIARTLGLAADEVPVIPNGIDAEAFFGLCDETRAVLRRAGVSDSRPLLLVPVRITQRKRLELAVEAAGLLRRAHPELQLVITGPLGPHDRANTGYAARLVELRARLGLEDAVHFLFEAAPAEGPHPVTAEMVAELYRLADLILLTSESEGFGLPVLEAALSRAPIVSPDLAVLEEVAGGEGLVTFPTDGDAAAVARAVERGLATEAARLRQRVLSRHDWPAVIANTLRALPMPPSRDTRG
jgi:glycosyltransferase involved in cell wall biosynthesis